MKYAVIVVSLCLNTVAFNALQASEDLILSTDKWIGITFENDVFLKTDYYYTNGIKINVLSPKFNFRFLKLFSLSFAGYTDKQRSFSFSQGMYTPMKTSTADIVFNDRPYAGTLTSGFKEHTYYRKSKIESEFEFGFLGNISGSGATQNIVHKAIGNDTVSGWKNQIHNDLIYLCGV